MSMAAMIITSLITLIGFGLGLWIGFRSGWLAGAAESAYRHQVVLNKSTHAGIITRDQVLLINQQYREDR